MMNFNPAGLIVSFLVSGVGFVFFRYGRKKNKTLFFIFGVIMMVYPYFITDFAWMLGIALGMSLILYWLHRQGF